MTVRSSYKTAAGYTPKQGGRELLIQYDFSAAASYNDSLGNEQQLGELDIVQSVFIDNADNASPLTITFKHNLLQRIVCPAGGQGFFQVLAPGRLSYTAACAGGKIASLIWSNMPRDTITWDASVNSGLTADAVATAASPTYVEGSTDPLSMNLNGGLRVSGDVASNAVDSGQPVKVGGITQNSVSANAFSDGTRQNFIVNAKGALTIVVTGSGGVPVLSLSDNVDAVAVSPTASGLKTQSRGTVFNGTTWDRMAGNVNGNFNNPYPMNANPISAASGNVANAIAAATLAQVAGKTTYITGFEVTGSGASAGLPVQVTVTNVITGTLTYIYSATVGVLLPNTPLIVEFPYPIPASAIATTIVVSCPALGLGNTNNAVVAHGFQL